MQVWQGLGRTTHIYGTCRVSHEVSAFVRCLSFFPTPYCLSLFCIYARRSPCPFVSSRVAISNMFFGCGSIKSGPILEYPLLEHNSHRCTRPIWLNIRKVRGKRGWLLRRCGRFLAADPTPEALGHHALQIGEYAYELHTDEANQKYLMVQRLTGAQIWMPTVTNAIVGYCDLTDDEIAVEGQYHPLHAAGI